MPDSAFGNKLGSQSTLNLRTYTHTRIRLIRKWNDRTEGWEVDHIHVVITQIYLLKWCQIFHCICAYRIFVHGANCAHVSRPEPRENNWIKWKKSAATAPKSNAWLSASFKWIEKKRMIRRMRIYVMYLVVRSRSLFAFFPYSYVYLIFDAFRER